MKYIMKLRYKGRKYKKRENDLNWENSRNSRFSLKT